MQVEVLGLFEKQYSQWGPNETNGSGEVLETRSCRLLLAMAKCLGLISSMIGS